jgi:hypothetical protein
MPFYGNVFIYDSIPSEFHNISIGEFNGGGESTTSGSNNVEPLTQKLFRRPTPLFFGAEQTPVLSFPLSMYCKNEIDALEYSGIAKWLFGQQEYKKLRICQEDMYDTYFNCLMTEPEIMRIGNMIQGFKTNVVCDSPWGWKEPKEYAYTYTGVNVSDSITLFNESANTFYTYPTLLVITANRFGGGITITNTTDNDREFIIDTLEAYEVITMNCDLQFISSSEITYPLENFNKNWLRFIKGRNDLTITGNVSSISIISPVAVKVG